MTLTKLDRLVVDIELAKDIVTREEIIKAALKEAFYFGTFGDFDKDWHEEVFNKWLNGQFH